MEDVITLSSALTDAIEVEGTPSGVQGLDNLFFKTKIQNGKITVIPLNGIPKFSVVNITGANDTGKSIIAEQFTIKQASLGNNTVFVTVETPAKFLVSSLKERAYAMSINPHSIENNIFIVDAENNDSLRENVANLLDTLANVIKKYKIRNVVIDSVTGLYEAKEISARTIVRKIYNFLKKFYQTAILVSQKRSAHDEFSVEGAGGYAVPHIVDCNIAIAKKIIESFYDEKLYGKPIGEMVRLFRIDGCRMCGHDTSTRILEITNTGLVVIGKTLSELRSALRREKNEEADKNESNTGIRYTGKGR